jgi:hypothetical protein
MGVWKTILYACPDCGQNWSQYQGTMTYLMEMASKINKLTGIESGENKGPFAIRFEISGEKKP